jgi:hypothetical protein
MTLCGPRLPISLHPVIAEAKRRARRRRSLLALLVVLILTGSLAWVLATHPSSGPGGSGSGPGQQAQRGSAGEVMPTNPQQLLNQLVLPAGAQRLRVAPRGDGGLLRHAQTVPGAYDLGDLHRIWRVRKSYFSTTSFVENHLPRGVQGEGRGASGGPGIPYNNENDNYSLPMGGGVFWLDLTFVGLPHGWTGIRADALTGSCPCGTH